MEEHTSSMVTTGVYDDVSEKADWNHVVRLSTAKILNLELISPATQCLSRSLAV